MRLFALLLTLAGCDAGTTLPTQVAEAVADPTMAVSVVTGPDGSTITTLGDGTVVTVKVDGTVVTVAPDGSTTVQTGGVAVATSGAAGGAQATVSVGATAEGGGEVQKGIHIGDENGVHVSRQGDERGVSVGGANGVLVGEEEDVQGVRVGGENGVMVGKDAKGAGVRVGGEKGVVIGKGGVSIGGKEIVQTGK